MANEKRLVDVNPLMKDGWHLVKTGKSNVFIASMSLADVQTVDAVHVVRCRECLYYEKGKSYEPYCNHPTHGIPYSNDDDFCSYGERKDGDGNG